MKAEAEELLNSFGFERILCPFVYPKHDDFRNEDIYYGDVLKLQDGSELYIRSLRPNFNLLPRKALMGGLNKVYAIGPGIAMGREVSSLVHVQWVGVLAEDREALIIKLKHESAHINERSGDKRESLLAAFVCEA